MDDKLAAKRVLVAEDEAILALALEDMLGDMGCVAVGPAASLSEAERLARSEPIDAALLDINMGDGHSIPVAAMLRARGVPFCFCTGYGAEGVSAQFAGVPILAKPFSQQALRAVLQEMLGLSPG